MMLLMMKCPFERLVHLHIGFDEEDDLSGNLHTGAIAALKYLPQLKSLVICGNLLSFDSLEQIHRFLPSLEQLELKYSMTTFPKGIPIDIAPANKLTHFTCETERCDKNEQFVLQYILAKYPSLVHLYLSYDLIVTNSQLILIEYIASEMEPALLSFISQLPLTLTSFKSQSYRTTKPVIDTVARLSNMNEFHLCIDHRTGHDVATLEYCHSKGVLQSLERLWITAQYFNDIGTDVEFETSLKELNIDLVYERPLEPRNIFHFDSVFKVHPLLESLSIAAEGYGVDIGNGIEIDQLNVRELSLRVDILSDRVIPFIKNTMPYLKRLSLEVYNNGLSSEDGGGYEDEDGNKEIMVAHFSGKELSLPNHCLEHLSITAPLLRHNIICSVSSIIENKRKYYLFSQSESKVKYCGMEPPNVKEKKDEVYHYIDIHCKELWHLTVGDIEVF
ncbi:hypothetical protein K501DRAFT_266439 [Backusella circina FSU 941]|nr:hypothetical protein K501DRAFT_266439 [Backusella circina FSU 941]